MKHLATIVALSLLLLGSVALHIHTYADHKAVLKAIEVRQEEQARARVEVVAERLRAARMESDLYRAEAERFATELELERKGRKSTKQQTTDALHAIDGSDVDSLRVILHGPVE